MILMIQNFGSKPKMSCKTTTDVVITIGFRYFLKNDLVATLCPTTTRFRFLCINCNTEYSCRPSFEVI